MDQPRIVNFESGFRMRLPVIAPQHSPTQAKHFTPIKESLCAGFLKAQRVLCESSFLVFVKMKSSQKGDPNINRPEN
jgi:hypothetical protein